MLIRQKNDIARPQQAMGFVALNKPLAGVDLLAVLFDDIAINPLAEIGVIGNQPS